MGWNKHETAWVSRVPDHPLAQPAPPFVFRTPALAWDYGAYSEPLRPVDGETVVRVRLRVTLGEVGVALMRPNGSALLSQARAVGPGAGEAEVFLRLYESYGPARILLRTHGDGGPAEGEILGVEVGHIGDLPPGTQALGPDTGAEGFELPERQASNIAYANEPMRPISLGNTCEAKVQIARVLQFRRWPDTSQAAYRLMMLPPNRSKDRFGWDLFDWQGAPFNAVLAYLNNDFEGFFERADLAPHENGVINRRWGCEHFHDFEHLKKRSDPAFTEAMIDEGYPAARARFDELAGAFRQHLKTPGPYLYVHACEDVPSELRVRQLIAALSARSPDHRFHLLFVGFEDEDSDLSALSDQVSKAYRPRPPEAAGQNWEGDYAAWDKALAPFDLLLPAETHPSTQPERAELQPEPPRRGLLARLFAR